MKYTCTSCGIEKSSEEFYADKRNVIKGVRSDCKVCLRAAVRKRKKLIGCTAADRLRSTRWRNANIDRAREQERAKRARNIDAYRAAASKWAKANPDKRDIHKILKKTRIPSWYEADKVRMIYGKAKQFGFSVDHIVPLQSKLVCGLHVWANLQLLDKPLNSAKSNLEWPDMPDATQLSAAQLAAMTT